MKTEELLKPRYKVIADWPGSNCAIGEILMPKFLNGKSGWYDTYSTKVHGPEFYPHIFKRLEWWQDRTPDELKKAKYIKNIVDGCIFEVHRFQPGIETVVIFHPMKKNGWQDTGIHSLHDCLPATEQEYLNYLKTKA